MDTLGLSARPQQCDGALRQRAQARQPASGPSMQPCRSSTLYLSVETSDITPKGRTCLSNFQANGMLGMLRTLMMDIGLAGK